MGVKRRPSIDEIVLGKLEKKEDDRNLLFARYLPRGAAMLRPPASVHRMHLVPEWPMYANDKLGDCTCAAVGHIEQLDSAAAGQPETPTEAQVVSLYDATGTGDTGRYCADVLKYWQQNGVGPEGTKLIAYVEVDPKNIDHVKLAIQLFGSVYGGVQLPVAAQAQFESEKPWAVTRGADAEPGGWGGHCIPLFDFTTRGGPVCVTWAQAQRITWQWWRTYADEAYAPITSDWFNADGVAPGGYKIDALMKDLAAVQS